MSAGYDIRQHDMEIGFFANTAAALVQLPLTLGAESCGSSACMWMLSARPKKFAQKLEWLRSIGLTKGQNCSSMVSMGGICLWPHPCGIELAKEMIEVPNAEFLFLELWAQDLLSKPGALSRVLLRRRCDTIIRYYDYMASAEARAVMIELARSLRTNKLQYHSGMASCPGVD